MSNPVPKEKRIFPKWKHPLKLTELGYITLKQFAKKTAIVS